MASIDDIIASHSAQATEYSSNFESRAREAISAASGMFSSITPATVNWTAAISNVAPTTTAQTIDATFHAPTKPAAFDRGTFQTLDAIDPLSLPATYDVDISDLFTETAPEILSQPFTETAPATDFAAIDTVLGGIVVPELNTIDMPVLANLSPSAMPSVTTPAFTAVFGADDPAELDDAHTQFVVEYERVLPVMKAFIDDQVDRFETKYAPQNRTAMAALEAKIQDGLDNGTALSQTYETALYTRARTRVEQEYNRVIDQIENAHRKSGFVIPSGVRNAGIAKANMATAANLSAQSTEVAIKKAEQEIQHIQFVMGLSSNIRQTITQLCAQYAGTVAQINQMANEHGKAFIGLELDALRSMQERYRLFLSKLQTEAQIYETRLKAAFAQLEIHKLEQEDIRLSGEIDSLKLQQVDKKIAIEMATIERINTLLKSVEMRANIERQRIGAWSDKVDGHVKLLAEDEMRQKVFLSALQGDEGKMKGRLAKLDAYSKTVEAETRRVEGDVKIQALRADNNRMLLDVYKTEFDLYKTQADVASTEYEGQLKRDIALLEAYKSNKELELKVYLGKMEEDKLKLDKAINQAKLENETQQTWVNAWLSHWQLQSRVIEGIAQQYGSIAGSLWASQNTMVSQQSTV